MAVISKSIYENHIESLLYTTVTNHQSQGVMIYQDWTSPKDNCFYSLLNEADAILVYHSNISIL